MSGVKYFFDLPVYRLARDQYYRERDDHIDSVLFPKESPHTPGRRARDLADPTINEGIRNHIALSYGGCWEFNEIIGYIRLHFLGTQVRGEYWSVAKKRIVRTRTRTIEYQTWKLASEVDIPRPYTSIDILKSVRTYIDDCRKEVPRRHIEASMFEAIADSIDWAALLRRP